MWEIVRAGGPLMWPIILCSVIALGIVVERMWTLQAPRVMPPGLLQKVWQLVEAGQVTDKVIAALEQNSPLGRVLAAGLASRHRPRAVMMERLEDTGRHVVHELERFLNTLGTIAAVSPLLGLLGTVWGLIEAFATVATKNALGRPELLASGVYQALVTTAAGLSIAIPAVIAYYHFKSRIEDFSRGVEHLYGEIDPLLVPREVSHAGA